MATAATSLLGGAGDDGLSGNEGDDTLLGDDGNDIVLGDAGNDRVFGGAGDDTVLGEAGIDFVDGQSGIDIVTAAGNLAVIEQGDFASGETVDDALLIGVPWAHCFKFTTIVEPALAFGNYVAGSIHGYKFEDLNGNGADDGEPRLEGVIITLTGTDGMGNSIGPITMPTDANGEFWFLNLKPGTYTVTETVPFGATATTPESFTVTVESGQNLAALPGQAMLAVIVDFENSGLSEGDSLTMQIPGLTFSGAIIAEPGSPLIGFGNAGTQQDDIANLGENFTGTFITDELVGGRPGVPGTIEVEFDSPVSDLHFRLADLDRNEVVTSEIFDADGFSLQTITESATAPSAGDGEAILIAFASEGISKLSITIDDPTTGNPNVGWGVDNLTFIVAAENEVVVGPELSFGNTYAGSIHGYKLEDLNGNGIDDGGSGQTVVLDQEFAGAGDEFAFVAGPTDNRWAQTFTVGIDGTLDSVDLELRNPAVQSDVFQVSIYDTVAGVPNTALATLNVSGSSVSTNYQFQACDFSSFSILVSAGDELAIVVGGPAIAATGFYEWRSTSVGTYSGGKIIYSITPGTWGPPNSGSGTNPNGDLHFRTHVTTAGAGEPRVEGVSITLTGSNGMGDPIAPVSVTTDSNGEYWFEGLAPGVYTVTETPLPGTTPTTPASYTVTVQSRQELVAEAGQAMLGFTHGLSHYGFHVFDAAELNLDGNGGLFNGGDPAARSDFEGLGLLTDGPGGRGLDFDNTADFRAVPASIQDDASGDGFVIDQDEDFSNLFLTVLHVDAANAGNWEFQINFSNDHAGVWLDLDQDDIFQSTSPGLGSNRGEQLLWNSFGPGGTATVNLAPGDYLLAFTHGQGPTSSQLDIRIKSPTMSALAPVKPTDPDQDGFYWTTWANDPREEVVIGPELAFGNAFGGSIHGYKFEDLNGDGIWQQGIEPPLENVTITLTSGSNSVAIIDDEDPGYTSGGFTEYGVDVGNPPQGYHGDLQFSKVGSGADKAFWEFKNLVAGRTHKVSVTWTEHVNRALDAPFAVLDGNRFTGSPFAGGQFSNNQQLSPAAWSGGTTFDVGLDFADLGIFTMTGSTLTVRLTDGGSDLSKFVIADAVRVEALSTVVDTATTNANGEYWFMGLEPGLTYMVRETPPADSVQTTFNPPPIFLASGIEWVATAQQRADLIAGGVDPAKIMIEPKLAFGNFVDRTPDIEVINLGPDGAVGGGDDVALNDGGAFDFGVTALNVPVTRTFQVGNTGSGTLDLSNLVVGSGFSIAGGFTSTSLTHGQTATFTVRYDATAQGTTSGQLTFDNNDPDENAFNFAVTGRVSPGGVTVTDDGNTGWTGPGFINFVPQGFADRSDNISDVHYSQVDSGKTATWQFTNLVAGTYRVSTTYTPHANRATAAPFSVYDQSGLLLTTPINRQQAPNDFGDLGYFWEDITGGVLVTDPDGPGPLPATLRVTLRDLVPGQSGKKFVIADAVRIEKLEDAPEIEVRNGVSATDPNVQSGTTIDFGTAHEGTAVTRDVLIRNVGSAVLNVIDVSLTNTQGTAFGLNPDPDPIAGIAPGGNVGFQISLDGSVAGTYAATVTIVSNDADEGTFSFNLTATVTSALIIDNGDAGFMAPAFTRFGPPTNPAQGYQDDVHYHAASSGANTAAWSFHGLAAGLYQVAATWTPHSNRANNSPFTVSGTTSNGSVVINQRQAPSSFAGSFLDLGVFWVPLNVGGSGGTFQVNGATLTVTLGTSTTGFVIADAVRIELLSPFGVAAPAGGDATTDRLPEAVFNDISARQRLAVTADQIFADLDSQPSVDDRTSLLSIRPWQRGVPPQAVRNDRYLVDSPSPALAIVDREPEVGGSPVDRRFAQIDEVSVDQLFAELLDAMESRIDDL